MFVVIYNNNINRHARPVKDKEIKYYLGDTSENGQRNLIQRPSVVLLT